MVWWWMLLDVCYGSCSGGGGDGFGGQVSSKGYIEDILRVLSGGRLRR